MNQTRTGRRPGEQRSIRRVVEGWQKNEPGVYRCMVYLVPRPEDRFSVIAATLPGVTSQADSEPEALANIAKALQDAITHYKEQGRSIPWLETALEPEVGAKTRWVIART